MAPSHSRKSHSLLSAILLYYGTLVKVTKDDNNVVKTVGIDKVRFFNYDL